MYVNKQDGVSVTHVVPGENRKWVANVNHSSTWCGVASCILCLTLDGMKDHYMMLLIIVQIIIVMTIVCKKRFTYGVTNKMQVVQNTIPLCKCNDARSLN